MIATADRTEEQTDFEECESVTVVRANPVSREDVELYMDLVLQVVARTIRRLPRTVLREDLVAAGTYGLMDALRKSRGERDDRFIAYARIRIRGSIIDELRKQDWLARSARADANARAMSSDASASSTVMALDDLPESQCVAQTESPTDAVERRSERAALARAMSRLPEREAHIVDLHYFQGVPFKDVAVELGVSEARISQLHTRALSMLKPILTEAGVAGVAA